MSAPQAWLLTDEDGFTLELPQQFKPEEYTPATGGQVALVRAYGSKKVYQTTDSIGVPQPMRLSYMMTAIDEVALHAAIDPYVKLVEKAAAITRAGTTLATVTLIKGANYVEFEVQPKAKRVKMTLVLAPAEVVNGMTIWGTL